MNDGNPGGNAEERAKKKGEVGVDTVVSTEDLEIGIEDVLVAPLCKKTLIARGLVFTVIAGILEYEGCNTKEVSARARDEGVASISQNR